MTERYQEEGLAIPETPEPGEDPKPWGETRVVGEPLPRVDAYQRLSGSALYPSDLILPGMLYGAILRCPHPHARVKRVDTSEARKMPGVRGVIDGSTPEADLPWPPLAGSKPKRRLFDRDCRFEGEAVAAVAADTPYQARDALRAIRVDYEILPAVTDEGRALEPGAPKVHRGGNRRKEENYERGNVERGFAEADLVLEETYRTACEIHTPMELHGCVANWEGARLTVWESTQGVYSVQAAVAESLGLPLADVRVIGRYMGGGFGSKLKSGKYTIIAALLARRCARPVKLFLSREETFLAVGNRPPATMVLKAGARKDGSLTALDFSVLATGGAYPAGGTALIDWQIKDLYSCPNVRTKATDVYIHAGPARPFRAPGHPQGSWALEQMLDALAEGIGMDPVELRLKNIPSFSQGRRGNPPYTTTGLKRCIEEGAEAFGWKEAREIIAAGDRSGHLKRGVGMASSLWIAGSGGPPSTVVVKLYADGSVGLNMGASDIGTGTKTVMAMVAAEELGVEPGQVRIENADTGTTSYATASGGSKTVPTEAPAVRAAAVEVKRQILEMAAEELRIPPAELRFEGKEIVAEGDRSKRIALTEISKLKKRGLVMGTGYRGPNPEGKAVTPFAAQFCEVEVNTKSGEVRILRFLGANESGRVMNRLNYDSQVFGGITMGIGLAMTEARVLDGKSGKMLNKNWHDYRIPTAPDLPSEMVSAPVELPDDEANTVGAKGLGEPVTIPTAAALANAIYHAVGIRVTETPITPQRLARLLAEKRKEG